jgi:hypothetical protein
VQPLVQPPQPQLKDLSRIGFILNGEPVRYTSNQEG